MFGRLFQISEKDWPIIAHKEGGVTGMSVERAVKVRVADKEVQATAFATNPNRVSSEGAESPRFVEALVRGATSAGLPTAWISSLGPAAK